MGEPRLENIDDYDTLKGEKKKVVWGVIIGSLVVGAIYIVAYNYYNSVDDSIGVQESIKTIPIR